jgi:hypothetical protein
LLLHWWTRPSPFSMEEQFKHLHRCTQFLEPFRLKSMQMVWGPLQLRWQHYRDKLESSRFARPPAFKFSASQILEEPYPFINQSYWCNPGSVRRLSWAYSHWS